MGCVLFSLQQGVPAGIVALVVALQPMLTGALSGPVVGEHSPLTRWFGLFVGFCGVIIAVGARTNLNDAGSVFGYFIPFGSVVGNNCLKYPGNALECMAMQGSHAGAVFDKPRDQLAGDA